MTCESICVQRRRCSLFRGRTSVSISVARCTAMLCPILRCDTAGRGATSFVGHGFGHSDQEKEATVDRSISISLVRLSEQTQWSQSIVGRSNVADGVHSSSRFVLRPQRERERETVSALYSFQKAMFTSSHLKCSFAPEVLPIRRCRRRRPRRRTTTTTTTRQRWDDERSGHSGSH